MIFMFIYLFLYWGSISQLVNELQRKYYKLSKYFLFSGKIFVFFFANLQFINLRIYNMPGHDIPHFGLCRASTKNFLSLFCTIVLCAIGLANGDSQKNQSKWWNKSQNRICPVFNSGPGIECICLTHSFSS